MIELAEPDPVSTNRPADELIVQCIADAFHIDFQEAMRWLQEVDFSTLQP